MEEDSILLVPTRSDSVEKMHSAVSGCSDHLTDVSYPAVKYLESSSVSLEKSDQDAVLEEPARRTSIHVPTMVGENDQESQDHPEPILSPMNNQTASNGNFSSDDNHAILQFKEESMQWQECIDPKPSLPLPDFKTSNDEQTAHEFSLLVPNSKSLNVVPETVKSTSLDVPNDQTGGELQSLLQAGKQPYPFIPVYDPVYSAVNEDPENKNVTAEDINKAFCQRACSPVGEKNIPVPVNEVNNETVSKLIPDHDEEPSTTLSYEVTCNLKQDHLGKVAIDLPLESDHSPHMLIDSEEESKKQLQWDETSVHSVSDHEEEINFQTNHTSRDIIPDTSEECNSILSCDPTSTKIVPGGKDNSRSTAQNYQTSNIHLTYLTEEYMSISKSDKKSTDILTGCSDVCLVSSNNLALDGRDIPLSDTTGNNLTYTDGIADTFGENNCPDDLNTASHEPVKGLVPKSVCNSSDESPRDAANNLHVTSAISVMLAESADTFQAEGALAPCASGLDRDIYADRPHKINYVNESENTFPDENNSQTPNIQIPDNVAQINIANNNKYEIAQISGSDDNNNLQQNDQSNGQTANIMVPSDEIAQISRSDDNNNLQQNSQSNGQTADTREPPDEIAQMSRSADNNNLQPNDQSNGQTADIMVPPDEIAQISRPDDNNNFQQNDQSNGQTADTREPPDEIAQISRSDDNNLQQNDQSNGQTADTREPPDEIAQMSRSADNNNLQQNDQSNDQTADIMVPPDEIAQISRSDDNNNLQQNDQSNGQTADTREPPDEIAHISGSADNNNLQPNDQSNGQTADIMVPPDEIAHMSRSDDNNNLQQNDQSNGQTADIMVPPDEIAHMSRSDDNNNLQQNDQSNGQTADIMVPPDEIAQISRPDDNNNLQQNDQSNGQTADTREPPDEIAHISRSADNNNLQQNGQSNDQTADIMVPPDEIAQISRSDDNNNLQQNDQSNGQTADIRVQPDDFYAAGVVPPTCEASNQNDNLANPGYVRERNLQEITDGKPRNSLTNLPSTAYPQTTRSFVSDGQGSNQSTGLQLPEHLEVVNNSPDKENENVVSFRVSDNSAKISGNPSKQTLIPTIAAAGDIKEIDSLHVNPTENDFVIVHDIEISGTTKTLNSTGEYNQITRADKLPDNVPQSDGKIISIYVETCDADDQILVSSDENLNSVSTVGQEYSEGELDDLASSNHNLMRSDRSTYISCCLQNSDMNNDLALNNSILGLEDQESAFPQIVHSSSERIDPTANDFILSAADQGLAYPHVEDNCPTRAEATANSLILEVKEKLTALPNIEDICPEKVQPTVNSLMFGIKKNNSASSDIEDINSTEVKPSDNYANVTICNTLNVDDVFDCKTSPESSVEIDSSVSDISYCDSDEYLSESETEDSVSDSDKHFCTFMNNYTAQCDSQKPEKRQFYVHVDAGHFGLGVEPSDCGMDNIDLDAEIHKPSLKTSGEGYETEDKFDVLRDTADQRNLDSQPFANMYDNPERKQDDRVCDEPVCEGIDKSADYHQEIPSSSPNQEVPVSYDIIHPAELADNLHLQQMSNPIHESYIPQYSLKLEGKITTDSACPIPMKYRIIDKLDTEVTLEKTFDQAVPVCESRKQLYSPTDDTPAFREDPAQKESLPALLPLKTSSKPRRVGLSKRQLLPRLHQYFRGPTS